MKSWIFTTSLVILALLLSSLAYATDVKPAAVVPAAGVSTNTSQMHGCSIAVGKDKDGHLEAILENSRLRVRYGYWLDYLKNGSSSITEFFDKRTHENQSGMTLDACAHRDLLTNAYITVDTPTLKTIRLEFSATEYDNVCIQDVSITPDTPYLKIDYRKYAVNIWEIGGPGGSADGGAYAVYGGGKWKRGYVLHENAYYSRMLYDWGTPNIQGIDQPGPLDYHGWFIMTVSNKTNGRGYGRLAPVAEIDMFKLLEAHTGFELFPNAWRFHNPFTSYLFLTEGGTKGAVRIGTRLADKVGRPATIEARRWQWLTPIWRFRAPINVDVKGVARLNQPVETPIDLHALLAAQKIQGQVDAKSLRLVEISPDGLVLDTAVPCQFDSSSNAPQQGTFTFMLTGNTAADALRHYLLYFDLQGHDAPTLTMMPLVSVADVPYQGQDTLRITTVASASRATKVTILDIDQYTK